MDVLTIRRALKTLRKRHWPNNRAAAKAMGIGASTVAKVENLKTEKDYDPGIGIVSAFITAAAKYETDLSLSAFFRQLEALADESAPDLQNQALPTISGQSKDRVSVSLNARGAGHGGVALSEVDPDVAARVGRALIHAGLALARPDAGSTVEQSDRPLPKTRRKK